MQDKFLPFPSSPWQHTFRRPETTDTTSTTNEPLRKAGPHSQKDLNAPRVYYPCEVQCPECKKWRLQPLGKQRINSFLARLREAGSGSALVGLMCDSCLEIHDAASKAEEHQRKVAWLEDYRTRKEAERAAEAARKENETLLAITDYLDPIKVWNSDFPPDKWLHAVRSRVHFPDRVATAIKTLSYDQFLETPYWKAVAWEVKRRAEF